VRRKGKSSFRRKPAWARALETIGPRIKNRVPVVKQIRAFQAKRSAFKRRIVGSAARVATGGYVKPLSHKSLRPCTGVRKAIRRAYFGFKAVKNVKRGGNRAKDYRPRNIAKSRFTVLNCK
jgi:hypothetical protein